MRVQWKQQGRSDQLLGSEGEGVWEASWRKQVFELDLKESSLLGI